MSEPTSDGGEDEPNIGEEAEMDGASATIVDTTRAEPKAFDALFGDESEEWPVHQASRGFRAPWLATVLLALLLVSSGLWLGAYLQRHESSPGSTGGFSPTSLTPRKGGVIIPGQGGVVKFQKAP